MHVMSKIEEILNKNFELMFLNGNECELDIEFLRDVVSTGLDYETLIDSIKEYAEYYSNQYKQIIINNCSNYDGVQMIEQEDIEELKLPDHE